MDPITPLIGLGIAGASAVTTGIAQKQQNKALANAQTANQEAAAQSNLDATAAAKIQRQQLADQTALERMKAANDIAITRGRLRAVMADSGFGTGGSALAVQRQLAYDATLNDAILRQNLTNNVQRVDSGLVAQVNQTTAQANNVVQSLQSQKQNPFLTAFASGVGGLGTGLAIGTGLKGIS
jgi:hypothetical protein